jgi:type II secretory pathway pseudopilin PulG
MLSMQRTERGIALLEVLVALAILGAAGAGLVAALGAGIRAGHDLRRRELEMAVADRVLAATALLSRDDLDRRLGRHPVGEVLVEVQRPQPALYRIGIRELRNPELETLVTVVYRPEPSTK